MTRENDSDVEHLCQRGKGSLGLAFIPTKPVQIPPAIFPAQDQVAGNEFPRGLIVENHRLLRMTRCGDHLPATEANPRPGKAIPFEITDPVRIGHALEIPEERQRHTGRTVKGQIGPFLDAEETTGNERRK